MERSVSTSELTSVAGQGGAGRDQKKGQRTRYAGRYSEGTLALSHWVGTTVQMRPEIRLDHAWDNRAYDKGKRRNQFTISTDAIFHF
jgi:hypothetical protein